MKSVELIKSALILLCCIISLSDTIAQTDESKPLGNLLTPYDAIFTYSYYLQPEHNYPNVAAAVFHKKGKQGRELALKLKQILDGKGLKFRLSQAPEDANFIDSISKKHVYTPFEKELPEIYLERNKESGRWYFSHESEREIGIIYKKVFPFGTHLLLNQLPKLGQQPLLGLELWQYTTMLILVAIGFLIHFITSRIFSFFINLIADSNLGRDRFDKKMVKRLGRILSYLLISYMIFVFVPVLQLPTGLVYYILLLLRLTRTVLFVFLALRIVSLIRSYMLFVTAQTPNPTDEHLVPIIARVINVLIVSAGVVQILSIFYVNVTALIAGLSIGGLAIALAAQETVKNLFGSMMIYADKPFKIGDMITVGAVTGTIEDIGFRSTRIRTLDTSLISIPNGNLMNETINNLGLRKKRRYNTALNLAYHTPPLLVESFVEGLREIAMTHPEVDKEEVYIHLNNLGPSSIDIIFVIFFNTNDWALELKWKEEVISSILELAASLGIQFAYPTTALHIETMPDRKSNISDYKEQLSKAKQRLELYKQNLKQKYAKPEDSGDLESSDNNY
jgi:MscS family membrane protein